MKSRYEEGELTGKLIEVLERNYWVIGKQMNGLAHADSILQLPFRGNCLNWVLGHIVVHRDKILATLGEPPVLGEKESALYLRGSEPIVNSERAVSLTALSRALDQTQKRITVALSQIGPDDLSEILDEESRRTRADRIEFLLWHETYHVGQLEILRQLAGKDDAVIQ